MLINETVYYFQIICGDLLVQLHDQFHQVQSNFGLKSICKMPQLSTSSKTDDKTSLRLMSDVDINLSALSECPICRIAFDSKVKNPYLVGCHFASKHFGKEISALLGIPFDQLDNIRVKLTRFREAKK